ncbi:MAG TPA: ribonuclease H-like domain-containing protein [Dehalococcoidia bacterium]|nr:ribonuclease H-like domain-containing protein [Dehalococcoidia bacterium]
MSTAASGELFLDLETKKLSQEVPGGWNNIRSFGLALAVTWESETGFRTWFEDDAHALVGRLSNSLRIVGFNLFRFDYVVLSAYMPQIQSMLRDNTFDLLQDIESRLGHRLSLESLVSATLGRHKRGEGTQAVEWFRRGEVDKVIRYCQEDVALTRDLYYYGRDHGHVYYADRYSPGTRRSLKVDWPNVHHHSPIKRLLDILRPGGR